MSMSKRLSRVLILAVALVLVCSGYTQADFVKSGGKTMYQAANGSYVTGLQKINGQLYFFNSDGVLQTGKLKDAAGNMYIANSQGVIYTNQFFIYKKKRYYAFEDGKLAKGLQTIGEDLYYFRPNNAKMVKKAKKTVNGATYYFTADGKAAKNTWVKISGKYYYFESDGRMARNKFIGTRWYVDQDGVRKKASSVPKTSASTSSGKYLYNKSGDIAKNEWVKVDGKTYYAGSDGIAVTGLKTIDSKKYYFDEDGVMQTNTVVEVDGTRYIVAADGHITGTADDDDDDDSLDGQGAAIAKFAQQFVGNPYVWGGTDLKNGADCSGFCYAVYQKFGIQLMRVADDQMKGPSEAYQKLGYKKGIVIKDKDLAPGDLVFYGSSSYASHVAMYIGNNKVVHAANSRLGIIISDMDYVKSRVKNHGMRYWS